MPSVWVRALEGVATMFPTYFKVDLEALEVLSLIAEIRASEVVRYPWIRLSLHGQRLAFGYLTAIVLSNSGIFSALLSFASICSLRLMCCLVHCIQSLAKRLKFSYGRAPVKRLFCQPTRRVFSPRQSCSTPENRPTLFSFCRVVHAENNINHLRHQQRAVHRSTGDCLFGSILDGANLFCKV